MGVLLQNENIVGGIDSSLIAKIGATPLNTTAQDLSSAINEHESDIISIIDIIGNDSLTTTAQYLTGAINELNSNKVNKSGDSITGRLTCTETMGQQWAKGFDGAPFRRNVYTDGSSYNAILGWRNSSGYWSIGSLSNASEIYFIYTRNYDYNNNLNVTDRYYITPVSDGTTHTYKIAHSGNLGNVAWANAGTAINISDGSLNHANYGPGSGTSGASSNTSGGTVTNIPYITTNAQGHVTARGVRNHTIWVDRCRNSDDNARVLVISNNQISFQTDNYVSCNNKANSGYVKIMAKSFEVASSKKIKENIKDMEYDEAKKLLDVRVVDFDYKKELGWDSNQHGVIAEELSNIIPYAVSVPQDYDESSDDYMNVPSVDYSKLVPYLIKMVQIQQKEIEQLKERS